jgi:transcription elongation factor Elf1
MENELLKSENSEKPEILSEIDEKGQVKKRRISPKSLELNQKKLKKSNEFLELYKQGLSYQDIGDKYSLSRERVRQVLTINPDFHEYLKARNEEKFYSELEKEQKSKQNLYARSLANLYPERIIELYDFEKNENLPPEKILAYSSSQTIWLKCPIDGNSWAKRVVDITAIWKNNGTSGCPVCAGKTKKSEKQPNLIEVYPELISQYWDNEKNAELGLDLSKLTLSSNRKAWFKCPHDGNEWESRVMSTVKQQWSKGNAGCRVCNGTDSRKRGEWKRRESIAFEFSDEIAKYWFYEANNELKLDPMKLTIGSSKEAFFKCPIDGYEWVATIASITKSAWTKGNSGCPACRGLVSTKTTSLVALYPDYVDQYWDHKKNTELGLSPHKVTRGSQQEAWFKCPKDGFEWKTRIGSITKSSWSLGNSGCACCSGWNLEAIRQFVASLETHIPNLTQAELYKIFEQSGVLDTKNSEGLKIVKDIIRGKLSGQKLKDLIQGKEVKISESEIASNGDLFADAELQIVDAVTLLAESATPQAFDNGCDLIEDLDINSELPQVRVQKSLEFLSSKIIASADQEAVEFFVASRRNRIWAEVFENESAIEGIEAFTDEGYGRQVRDQFLDEYNQARDMTIPAGWAFRVNGKITPPNLMQKLAAVRLRSQQRMLNLSLTGTGKTIGGILSSRIIDAHLTIIICPLDTVQNWHGEIKQVFPDSRITNKSFNPYWVDIEDGHYYIILNHEMFQQPSTAANIRQLLDRYTIDLIVVDEIHRCKQRSDDPSKRRQMVLALITNAAEKNPDLHVLGMSATPVINNLKEGKSLVELVTGVERSDIGEKATLNNCMRLHQAFATLGIRSRVKPKISINRVTVPVDCTHLVDEIRENGTSILKMEQILTSARIPEILKELRPKTIIYTHYGAHAAVVGGV